MAVLNVGIDGIETRDDAAQLFKSNDSFLQRMTPRTGSLQVVWIHRSFQEIQKHLSKLDFSRIAKFQDANQSTAEIFENVVNSVEKEIKQDISGVLVCIEEIYKEYGKFVPLQSLSIINDIKSRSLSINRLCWTVRHPFIYLVTSRNLILSCIILSIVAVPAWYLFGWHQMLRGGSHSVLERPAQDVEMLRVVIANPDQSAWTKIVEISNFFWNALLAIPSLLLIPAAVIATLRKVFRVNNDLIPLRKYEIMFRAIASDLQRSLPAGMRGPLFMVEFEMSGNVITTFGNGNNVITQSANVSLQTIQAGQDADIASFLKAVADEIDKSKNMAAQALFGTLTAGLKEPRQDKSALRQVWEGLVAILPSVGSIAGGAGAIAKLFG